MAIPTYSRGQNPFCSAPYGRFRMAVAALVSILAVSACDSLSTTPTYDEAPARIQLSMANLDLDRGDTSRVRAVVLNGSGSPIASPSAGAPRVASVSWISSDPSIAAVSRSGLIHAQRGGQATITATSGALTSTSTVSVRSKGKNITISPKVDTLHAVGHSLQLSATVLNGSGKEVASPSVTWTSQDPEVAEVDTYGRVSAIAAGAVMIVASSLGQADSARVVVKQGATEPPPVVSIVEVAPGEALGLAGENKQFTASVKDGSGKVIMDATVVWSSSDPVVATVDAKGLVAGKAAGSAVIRATADGKNGSATMTVDVAPAPPVGASTEIYPGDNIQAKVDSHPAGTTFYVKAGVHRHQMVKPKDGNSFIGEPGAVLSGARLLTEFIREGSYWVATGQTQRGQVHGLCSVQSDGVRPEGCKYPEDLFFDDEFLTQVTSLSEVSPGKWFFDYAANKIYFVDSPTGRKIETSVTTVAFSGAAKNVTIQGLIIEKYANPAQQGAVHAASAREWFVEGNEIRLNHGVGVRIGHSMRLVRNKIHGNGQLGIGGVGDDVLVEGNEIAQNNVLDFSAGWEAGGTKFVRTNRLVVRGNHSHHNRGPGLWTDIDNIHTLFEDNRVEDNDGPGIFHEISYDAIIRNNIVLRNGHGDARWLWGAGILIAASPNVEVYGNVVSDNGNGITGVQQNRGAGALGQWELRNLHVHSNTVSMREGRTGVATDTGDMSVFTIWNNRFEGNTYHLGSNRSYFHWSKAWSDETDWQGFNQDKSGKFFRL